MAQDFRLSVYLRYSVSVASIGTYPGIVSPLRGLAPFSEAEREVFYGRETDIAELTNLVTGAGFRAGLLYGESGVGKTSLLRAGLVPHLRDHGVIALLCDDIRDPGGSFVRAVSAATGTTPGEGEHPMVFLSRAVASSIAGQLFLFILDEVEVALRHSEEHVATELGELFTRVVTRSGGRGRFLFSCNSSSVHRFGALERRTGSLFPPSSRYELTRFRPEDATTILERTWSIASIVTEPELSTSIVESLAAPDGLVLPAELQVAALAVRDLGIASRADLERIGGPGQLDEAWITTCAKETGDKRATLRLLGELAYAPEGATYVAEWAAARAITDPQLARHALEILQLKGLVEASHGNGVSEGTGHETHYALAHRLLVPRVREIAAPVRAATRRAYELFGAKTGNKARLSLRECWALYSERISPTTPSERALIERTKRFYLIAGGAALAIPVVIVIAVYIAMAGRYYLDAVAVPGASGERVVVRAGRPGLSAFDWLPGSSGQIVADTGLSRPMVSETSWQSISAHDVTGDIEEYDKAALDAIQPTYRALIEYATSGSAQDLEELRRKSRGPAEA